MTTLPKNPPETQRIIDWANAEGLPVRQPTPHQIKIGCYNIWPRTGKWNCDELPARVHVNFKRFQEAVLAWAAGFDG